MNYSRGMSGYLLVADGTRPSTLERAREIYERLCSFEQPPPSVEEAQDGEPDASKPYIQFPYREVPFILLLNKSDLVEQWRIEKVEFGDAGEQGMAGAGGERQGKRGSGGSVSEPGAKDAELARGEIAAPNRNKFEVKGLRSSRSKSDWEGPELRNSNLCITAIGRRVLP